MDDRLEKFSRVIECGSFTKAAKELHISQPALSMAIDKLEKELQATLVTREDGRLVLTKAGELAYRAATAKQQLQTDLLHGLSRLSDRKPHLSFGMIDSVAERICALDDFANMEASMQLNLIVNNSRYLREAVKSRAIDCAIVVDDNLSDTTMLRSSLPAETLVLACLASKQSLYQQAINGGNVQDFIAYDTPSNTYRYTIKALRNNGLKVYTRINSTSPSLILDLVMQGKGVGFIPKHKFDKEANLKALEHEGKPIVCLRPLTLISLRSSKPVPEVMKLISQVKSPTL